jgi:hypothetical protein
VFETKAVDLNGNCILCHVPIFVYEIKIGQVSHFYTGPIKIKIRQFLVQILDGEFHQNMFRFLEIYHAEEECSLPAIHSF